MNPELEKPELETVSRSPAELSDYPQVSYEPGEPVDVRTAPMAAAPQTDELVEDNLADAMIRWRATGRSQKRRGAWWHFAAVGIAIALIVTDLFLFKSYTFSVLVVVMLIALFVYIKVPPKEVEYTLSSRQGLYSDDKLYHLSEFKAFGVLQNDDFNSVTLIPVRRFAPGVVVPFPDEVGAQLVDILGQRLPMEEVKPDLIDSLIRRFNL